MLGIRERARPAVPRRACDRALPGDEIAPGLLQIEQVLPFDAVPPHVDGTFARTGALPTPGMLFFDTETTGLSGGTGTRAFMVGASDFVAAGLRVRQLLITHLSAEPAMLRVFAGWLSEDTRLVSYNGRCYDAPLLATRYRLARQGTPLAGIEHLDLLFPSRRRYRGCGKTVAWAPSSAMRWASSAKTTCRAPKHRAPGCITCAAATPACCGACCITTSRTW